MLTYPLPKELIAKYPSQPRDSARLLMLDRSGGRISHHLFRDLPNFLHPGDCLVLNDTKVLRARLYGRRADTGGKVELLIILPHPDPLPQGERVYRCLGRPGKRLRPGVKLTFDHGSLEAEVLEVGTEYQEHTSVSDTVSGTASGTVSDTGLLSVRSVPGTGERLVRFLGQDVEKTLQQLGEIPLPPYLRRPVEPGDADWYQTVFAKHPGAVAAPTAGLHFTPQLLDRIRAQGVQVAFVTLHVGWGTFKPLRQEELRSGRLHPERYQIPAETAEKIEKTKREGGKIVAVGTTIVRALESWALATGDAGGEALARAHPHRFDSDCKAKRISGGSTGEVPPAAGPVARRDGEVAASTDLFIQPGFQFQVVDVLITNFHLPETSLLLLVAAFAGEEQVLTAYREAIREQYRFYSYGDGMLIV